MAKNVAIIGAGRIAYELIDLLPPSWTLSVVDIDEDALAQIPTERGGEPVEKVVGDATSRLVLQKVSLGPLSRVVILTRSDAVNLEIAKLIQSQAAVASLVCLLDDRDEYAASDLAEIEVIERSQALANLAFNRLGSTEHRGVELGLGQGELLETRILDGSPAAGRPLKHLHPQQWLVAGVYRDGKLIVPHGDTVLEVDDRVLLVGEPSVLASVRSFVRGGEPVFPLQFGAHIGYGPGAQTEEEARWLLEVTRSETMVAVDPAVVDMRGPAGDTVAGSVTAQALKEQGIGCLVIGPAPVSWSARVGLTRSRRKRLIAVADVPVLVARGDTPPVKHVLLAVGAQEQIRTMAHVAIDLARLCDAELTVLTVLPPALAHGEDQLRPIRELPDSVAHIASLYDVRVDVRHAEGNPIAEIREHAADYDLLVMGNARGGRNTIFTPDVGLFLLHEAPCSTLFVPWDATYR